VKQSLRGWVLLSILSIACCVCTLAQNAETSLRGVIKDPSGANVANVTVDLLNQATGATYHTVSNSSGLYVFPVVSPAKYQISVTASGFATQTATAELLVGQPATIDFNLSVQSATVNVEVSAAGQLLNNTDNSISNSVGNTTIQALPMEGRDPISLLSLQPGVLYIGQDPGTADSRQGSVAGGRSDQGNITLDGLDDNDQTFGTAFQGVLRSTLDSTQEFNVTTSNGTAAAGRSSGAQVDLVTKSGTNHYHGALYEYYRPTNTVANAYFLKYDQISQGLPNIPQKYVLNTFGGSIGGPALKDKLFYFFNYEGQRKAISQVISATVPTTTFMQGELQLLDPSGNQHLLTSGDIANLDAPCTGNTFNGQPVCPNGPGPNQAILQYYAPVPTVTPNPVAILGDGLNSGALFFASPNPASLNTSILRLDYNINQNNRVFVRGNLQKDTTGGTENLPGQPPQSFYDDNTKGIAAGYTWTPTPNIVNDVRYAYIRQGYQTSGIGQGEYVDVASLTQPTAQTRNSFLHVPLNNIVDTLTWTKHNHTLQFGGNWRMITNQHGTDANSFSGGSTNAYYASEADLPNPYGVLQGTFSQAWQFAYANMIGIVPNVFNVYNYQITSPSEATALPGGAFVVRSFRSNEFEGFVQDTWRVRDNLNVTLGVRYTNLQTPWEMNGQQVAPTFDTHAWYLKRQSEALQSQVYEPLLELAPAGKANHAPGYWPKQKDNFAPRVGVSWSPTTKTTLRGGFGMYFDHFGEAMTYTFDQTGSYGLSAGFSNPADQLGFENSPRFTGPNNIPVYPTSIFPPASPTQSFPYAPPADGFGIDWGIDNRMKTPYAYNFNLSFQHEFPKGWTFEEDYVGRLGRHLLQQLDLTEPTNFVDPQGGGDYFSAARQLSKLVDAAPFGTGDQSGVKVNNNVPAIPYFEHMFPFMANTDYQGENATQAIFNNAWAPERYTNGETLSLAILDVFGIFPGSPNYNGLCLPTCSTFWTPQFSSLYAWSSIGNSSYNAARVVLRHPPTHGLTVDFGYTFSHSLDLGSETERTSVFTNDDNAYTNFGIQNTWNPKLNKGSSDFDTRHMITTDWVYQLPFGRGRTFGSGMNRFVDAIVGGWQWAGLGRWTSGLPFTISSPAYPTNYENPAFTFATQPIKIHKSIVDGIPQSMDRSTAQAISNGIYFGSPLRLPYAGEAGSRNNYYGDGFFDIDSSLMKNWKLGEYGSLRFAAEVYNITNSNRFDVSPGGMGSGSANPNLGVYDATLTTYRRMQFGLRYDF
jgi:Carboxypeptidase regulatory-like domain/TonB dependent receptor